MGGAVRRETDGRHAQSRMQDLPGAVVIGAVLRARARVTTLCALSLFALAATSALGVAQSPRIDSVRWDSSPVVDVDGIAGSIKASADSIARSARRNQTFRSRSDSIASIRTRQAADRSSDLRIVVSLNDRMLWAIMGPDTLLTAPVAVSTDETLHYAGRTWRFETPRGVRTVIAKRENPVWTPPEWHYAEVARENGLQLAVMKPGRTMLSDGSWLEVRNNEVGIVQNGEFALLPTDEEVIFDNTLFIPPIGTLNRRIEGELGHHMLDTGDGFLFHGTPHKATIGTAATHGCIRLRDEDIQWLYDMMPVGTRVYIY